MNHVKWSKTEKKIAREAFEKAYERECSYLAGRIREKANQIKKPKIKINGVGPRKVIDIKRIIVDFALKKTAYIEFFGGKKTVFLRVNMARAKRHYIPGYIWHTPVK